MLTDYQYSLLFLCFQYVELISMYSQKILKKDFFKYISGFLSEICGCTLSIEQIHNIYYKQFKNH